MKEKMTKAEAMEASRAASDKILKPARRKYEKAIDREFERHSKRQKDLSAQLEEAEKKAREAAYAIEEQWWNDLTEEERQAETASWKRK